MDQSVYRFKIPVEEMTDARLGMLILPKCNWQERQTVVKSNREDIIALSCTTRVLRKLSTIRASTLESSSSIYMTSRVSDSNM